MLYYSHQWMKTAKDYRQLLTITDPLTDDDTVLYDLLVHYNEKIYGKRPADTMSYNDGKNININRNEFFQLKKSQRIAFVFQTVMSMSTAGDILIGFEHLCTQSPLWLVDYVIDNWILIQNEKFKQKLQLFHLCIKFEIDNYCLFPQLPKNVTQQILYHITNAADFYSMQFICKRWYAIFHEESFWQDLYISRYGIYSAIATSRKMLYLIRVEGQLINEDSKFDELVNASIDLRQYTGNDVLKLWEDLTHQEQEVDSAILSRIDYILSNAFYYQMDETSDQYSVKLVINGFEDICSLSKLHLIVYVSEYKTLHFTDHMEELLIEYQSNVKTRYSLKFSGPSLFGFDFDCLGYISTENTLLTSTPSPIFPAFPMGLLICSFIMMTHPTYQKHFIKYLKSLESRCIENLSD